MKKLIITAIASFVVLPSAYAMDTVFDSMESAKEVKLAPAVKTVKQTSEPEIQVIQAPQNKAVTISNTTSSNTTPAVYRTASTSIKEQKFTDALVNLDDAQVELRQELADVTSKYTEALTEKEKAIANCKALKREINSINKKMKNVDKSKKMINKNMETAE